MSESSLQLRSLLVMTFFVFAALMDTSDSLKCIQCDRSSGWFQGEEHERQIQLCQEAALQPTECTNRSHTHCIVNWYRSSSSPMKVITERRCGKSEDAAGCTLYNSQITSRKLRHLLDESGPRRPSSVVYVEVCSETCPDGNCINGAEQDSRRISFTLLLLLIATKVLTQQHAIIL